MDSAFNSGNDGHAQPVPADHAKELSDQKQLFCKLLLLEIEKYESAVQKVKDSPTDDGKEDVGDEVVEWGGFKQAGDAEDFGRGYYHSILRTITESASLTKDSDLVKRYFDSNDSRFQIIDQGQIFNRLEPWLKRHNMKAAQITRSFLADFGLRGWNELSFAGSYTISAVLQDGKTLSVSGSVNVVMSRKTKKILHLVEMMDNDSD